MDRMQSRYLEFKTILPYSPPPGGVTNYGKRVYYITPMHPSMEDTSDTSLLSTRKKYLRLCRSLFVGMISRGGAARIFQL